MGKVFFLKRYSNQIFLDVHPNPKDLFMGPTSIIYNSDRMYKIDSKHVFISQINSAYSSSYINFISFGDELRKDYSDISYNVQNILDSAKSLVENEYMKNNVDLTIKIHAKNENTRKALEEILKPLYDRLDELYEQQF